MKSLLLLACLCTFVSISFGMGHGRGFGDHQVLKDCLIENGCAPPEPECPELDQLLVNADDASCPEDLQDDVIKFLKCTGPQRGRRPSCSRAIMNECQQRAQEAANDDPEEMQQQKDQMCICVTSLLDQNEAELNRIITDCLGNSFSSRIDRKLDMICTAPDQDNNVRPR